jgi:branched-chain amino acid transport system permease protein
VRRDYLILALVAAAAVVTPFTLPNDYYLTVLIIGALNAAVVVGLTLLMGYAGQVSIGHAAFYGLGAYVSGVLTVKHAWPVPAAFAAAVVVTAGIAWLVGRPALKLKGHYLAMATLAFGEIVHIVFNEMDTLTGGPSGMSGIPRPVIAGVSFDSDRNFYWLAWGYLVLVLLVSVNVIHSRVGRGMRVIHGSERAARAMGVDTAGYKTSIFVLSAIFAAAAGSLYAHFITFISPSSFGIGHSVLLVTMVAVGSMESIWGGLLGALVLTLLPEYLRVFRDYDILMYGAILMVIMIFVPRGLFLGVPELIGRLAARRGRGHASP